MGAAPACSSGGASKAASSSDASSAANGPDSGPDRFANCTWDLGSGTQTGTPPTQDNSADLSGAVLGTRPFDPTQQLRVVPVTVNTTLLGLKFGQGYLTRLTATDETAYLTIPVSNTGTDFPCFVEATQYQWMSATGQALNSTTDAFLDGTVGVTSSTIWTDTCLAPGDSGYFIEIELAKSGAALYSVVASIELTVSSTITGTAPTPKLVPTAYDVGTCSGARALRVEATASGGTISVGKANLSGSLGPVVLLDSDGVPAGWTFVSQMHPANVASGSTTNFYATDFTLAVSRAQVFLPFDPPNLAFMSQPDAMFHTMQRMQALRLGRAQRWQTVVDSAITGP